MGKLYFKPAGLLWGKTAAEAERSGLAGRVAGGEVAFAAVEIVVREGSDTRREWRGYSDLRASMDDSIAERLRMIEAARPPLAGLDFTAPSLMGIVNVTPDSFSDGGEHADRENAIAHGTVLAEAGASILDIGGESTRPYAEPTPEHIERERALPVVRALAELGHCVSIDTRKAPIMREAVRAGAAVINDVSALTHDQGSLAAALELGVPVVLMHSQGDPSVMQVDPRYDDVALDVFDWLEDRIAACEAAGIARHRLLIDPGIGFGKTHGQNLELLGSLTLFHGLGCPLVVGASRKGFVGKLTGEPRAGKRVTGSLGAALAAMMQGAQVARVHDVAETKQAFAVWRAAMVTQSMRLDGKFTRPVVGSYGP